MDDWTWVVVGNPPKRVAGFPHTFTAHRWGKKHYRERFKTETGTPNHLPTREDRRDEEQERERARMKAQLEAIKP